MGQLYQYRTLWEKNIVKILHIYEDRTILLLLNANQDIESESQDIKIGVAGPIFTQNIYQRFYRTILSILYTMKERLIW